MHEILYRKEHLLFREAFKSFLSKEIIPFYDRWEKEGIIPKNAWKKMGMEGYLCPWLEKKYGGYACRTDNGESVKGHRISELRGFLEVDEGVSSVPRLPGWSFQLLICGGVLFPPHCPNMSGPAVPPTDKLRKGSALPPVTS